MEWHRVLEIFGKGKGRGSGYVIAPGLAVTAWHVVDGLSNVEFRFLVPDDYGLPATVSNWGTACVRWKGTKDLDLALIATNQPFKLSLPCPPIRIARLGGRAPVPVDGVGFPTAAKVGTRTDTYHVAASVQPWSGVRSDTLVLAEGASTTSENKGWAGISGGGVFAGDRLVGVFKSVPDTFDSTLYATPLHGIFEQQDARQLLDDAGVSRLDAFVDADYVARLPRSGTWFGLRADYTRAVLDALCQVDHIGLAVRGVQDARVPALSSFTDRRLRVPGFSQTIGAFRAIRP